MHWGWTTKYFDATLILLYAFFIFFLGLVYYLQRESKREGYPMYSPEGGRELGFPEPPGPKTYETYNEGLVTLPNHRPPRKLAAEPLFFFPGAPLVPTGDPMVDAVGPASFAQRRMTPLLDTEGVPLVQPLRNLADEWSLDRRDPDPRGMPVFGADKLLAGEVVDIWIDRTTMFLRYLEVALAGDPADRVVMPLAVTFINGGKRRISTRAVLAHQFAKAPRLSQPDLITAREEDQVSAYFASGYLYATPERSEPLI
ncbi:MAG: PRC-barrel domain-containing protein [Caulobacteraceae bacterium]|nr:PRC-barrel domain-containing protein [Caulobacter sp.]